MSEPVSTRLTFRLLDERDAALYAALYTDADTMRHIAAPLSAERAARAFSIVCRRNRIDPWCERLWVLIDRGIATQIGLIGLKRAAAESSEAELGVVLPERFQARGYATEAIAALACWVFASDGLTALRTQHQGSNSLAIGLMRGLGFQPLQCDSEAAMGWRWQLTASEWHARRLHSGTDSIS